MTTETTAAPASATPAGTGLGANYWRLWASSAASNLADGVFWIAFPLLAIRLTDSPVLIAGVAVVGRLPWLIFVLIAGALADRLDRRRTMIGVSILRTVVALVIALTIVTNTDSLWLLYVTAFVLGVGETLFDTAAQSVMPSIVRRDDLSKANGRLYAVELTMNQFVGPPARRLPRRRRDRVRLRRLGPRVRLRGDRAGAPHRLVQAGARRDRRPAAGRRRRHQGGPALPLAPPAAADARDHGRDDEPRLVGDVRGVRPVRGLARARWASTSSASASS